VVQARRAGDISWLLTLGVYLGLPWADPVVCGVERREARAATIRRFGGRLAPSLAEYAASDPERRLIEGDRGHRSARHAPDERAGL
jgi:hypothetical protein